MACDFVMIGLLLILFFEWFDQYCPARPRRKMPPRRPDDDNWREE